MPNWAGSCWYYLRYLDPANDETFCDPENERVLDGPHAHAGRGRAPASVDPGGVDLYIGGVEHAVLHLLYARFWHKVLHDLGYVSSEEPFRKYFNQGMIQAPAYRDAAAVPSRRRRSSSTATGPARRGPGTASRSPASSARSASR